MEICPTPTTRGISESSCDRAPGFPFLHRSPRADPAASTSSASATYSSLANPDRATSRTPAAPPKQAGTSTILPTRSPGPAALGHPQDRIHAQRGRKTDPKKRSSDPNPSLINQSYFFLIILASVEASSYHMAIPTSQTKSPEILSLSEPERLNFIDRTPSARNSH